MVQLAETTPFRLLMKWGLIATIGPALFLGIAAGVAAQDAGAGEDSQDGRECDNTCNLLEVCKEGECVPAENEEEDGSKDGGVSSGGDEGKEDEGDEGFHQVGSDDGGAASAGHQGDPSNAEPDGFRGVPWGASKRDVLRAEGRPADQRSSRGIDIWLYNNESLSGLEVMHGFVFAKEKLVRGSYIVGEAHSNKNKFIGDFETLRRAVSDKYGSPNEDRMFWSGDLYRDDRSNWGMAVAVGDMTRYATWSFPKTSITLSLDGGNYDVNVTLEYSSEKYGHLEEEVKQEAASEKL